MYCTLALVHRFSKFFTQVVVHRRNNFGAGAGVGAGAAGNAGGVTYTKTYNTGGSFFDDIFNVSHYTICMSFNVSKMFLLFYRFLFPLYKQ